MTMLRHALLRSAILWAVPASAALVWTTPAVARAPHELDAKARARTLAIRGIELFHEGRAAEAYERITRAEALYPALTHRVYIARALAAMGRWVEAKHRYEQIVAEPAPPADAEPQREAYAEAKREMNALDARIPRVHLVVDGDATEVRVDGEVVDRERFDDLLVDPGQHRGEVFVGERSAITTFSATEGGRHEVVLAAPAGPARDEGTRVPAFIAYGIGGAALITGAVTGGLSLAKVSALEERCVDGHCPPEDEPRAAEARALGTASTVSFVVAGVAAATGLALTLWPPVLGGGDETAVTIRPTVGPAYLGIDGSF